MYRNGALFSLVFWLLSSQAAAQPLPVQLANPSFEGMPQHGNHQGFLLPGWHDCGFADQTAPDILPLPFGGEFNVWQVPDQGKTYLGLLTKKINKWEMVGQRLSEPLRAGVAYEFAISLCRSNSWEMPAVGPANLIVIGPHREPIRLRIWGGRDSCERRELLAVSPAIVDTAWQRQVFRIVPNNDCYFIALEAFYNEPSVFPYNGNLLVDNASAFLPSEDQTTSPVSRRWAFSRPLMGTEFRILLYSPDSLLAKLAAEAAFARMAAIEKTFSDYDPASEASRLSDNGGGEMSDDMYHVMLYATRAAENLGGIFDVSIGALTRLWRRAFRQKELPTKEELAAAKAASGYLHVWFEKGKRTLKLKQKGMRLDFGGIAAGFAVDEGMAVLHRYGIFTALVDGGGDILTGNAPPGKPGWEIEVPDTVINGKLHYEKLYFANTAVTTSGDTYRYIEADGKRYSHIIDPRTGWGVSDRRIVTVTAPSCIAADVWATIACISLEAPVLAGLNWEHVTVYVVDGSGLEGE